MAIYETGIDVSRYQGEVNWQAVAAAGKQFALVRIGSSSSGGVYIDPYFQRNIAGAKAAGMKVGAYYYTYARTEEAVINEVSAFLAVLEGLRLEYPVFVDVEDNSLKTLPRAELTRLVKFAMDILDQKGWLPGFYTYTSFANTNLDTGALAAYPFWVADYRGYVGFQGSYDLWQYSSTGRVNGIGGNVDLDYSYKNFLPLLIETGKNGYGKGPNLVPVAGKELAVKSAQALYYYSPDLNDLAGYLPLGSYPVTAMSDGEYLGYTWVTFTYGDSEFWATLRQGVTELQDAPKPEDCEEVRLELAAAQAKISTARQALEWVLVALDAGLCG